jgi:hypothetical protein
LKDTYESELNSKRNEIDEQLSSLNHANQAKDKEIENNHILLSNIENENKTLRK